MVKLLVLVGFLLLLLAALARRVRRLTWRGGLLPLLGLGLVGWLLHQRQEPAPRPAATGPEPPRLGGRLQRCAGCGVLLPESRALGDGDGRWFCSPRCREAGEPALPPASAAG